MDISLASLGALDIISLVILVFFFVLGLIKGFTWQVVRLATIVVGMAAAKALAPDFKGFLERTFTSLQDSQYTIYVAYFTIFVAIFIAGTILAILLSKVIKKLKLRSADSFFGGLVGLLTGASILIVLVIVLLSIFDEGAIHDEVKESHTFRYSGWAIDKATPFIPPEIREKLVETWDRVRKEKAESPTDEPPTDSDGNK